MVRLRKRYLWWLAAALLPVAFLFGLVLADSLRPVNRVHKGVTYEEVKALLGPPDSVDTRWSDGVPVYLWKFRGGSSLCVIMDREGRVQSKKFRCPEPEWRKRLRDLGLPIGKYDSM